MAANQAIINVGPGDVALQVTLALPAVNTSATTAIIDLGAAAPNSNAWQLGRFQITCPALPENTVTGITIALQAAPPSLTNSGIAPLGNAPSAFVTPTTAQTTTIAAVAAVGSPAFQAYQTAAFDSTGSTYEFYQWLVTVPAGVNTNGEILTITWIKDSN